MTVTDFSSEFYEPDELDVALYKNQVKNQKRQRATKKLVDVVNEVGASPPPTPEMLARRKELSHDFIRVHAEVFPDSTGVKPFGKVQQNSIYMGQDVFHGKSYRLLKLEPRGYAKTTRITNEALFAVLCGLQDYVIIVCSNLAKAAEIIDSVKTELMNNDQLLELFPGPIACFRHLDNNSMRARYQTYAGEHTFIKYDAGTIRFPNILGEPSSGRFMEIRPLGNLRGLNHKVKSGPDAGKVFRPTLAIFDDPQTYEEAHSESEVSSIIAKIKRDALRGGSHSRRVAALMSITPVCNGDVAFHFENNEHSWEIVKYAMLNKHPDAKELWLSEYAKIYTNYDRTIRGDRARALMEATQYVKENYEKLHAGADWTWDWAYGWEEDPQTEISPVQHAYNIIIDDGWEDFEYECQCNTNYGLYAEGETIHADQATIMSRVNTLPRRKVPQATVKIVTHIDVNMDFLSYVTVASGDPFHPCVIDYGTHPKQPGLFTKRNIYIPLKSVHPETSDYREVIYLGLKDLLQTLAHRPYVREDGVEVFNSIIGVDAKFEEDFIVRAIKDSALTALAVPCWGVFVGPDEELLHERNWPEGSRVYHNCVEKPTKNRSMDFFNLDTNFFKTEVHKSFNQTPGLRGSLTLFAAEWVDQHRVVAEHCNQERPEKEAGKRTDRTRIVWKEKARQIDNEYFDNVTACFALLSRFGIDIKPSVKTKITKEEAGYDMEAYMKQQQGIRLL